MYKSLEIERQALAKLKLGQGELLKKDVKESLKSFAPGSWVILKDVQGKKLFWGFVNPLVEDRYPAIHVIGEIKTAPALQEHEKLIMARISAAIKYRRNYKSLLSGARLIYGWADGLPGLIVDSYADIAIVQINTAGMEVLREMIHEHLQMEIQKKIVFLDNPTYRSREILPIRRSDDLPDELVVSDSGFNLVIPKQNMQKIGYYYDHRANRNRLEMLLNDLEFTPFKAVDLFSYVGSWGLHALRGRVGFVTFVDQADMQDVVKQNLMRNGFTDRGEFIRGDVFDVLDGLIERKEEYQLVISDPPAFAKSPSQTKVAIEGYIRLHRKCLRLLNGRGYAVFASCTHYVGYADFMETVEEAARRESMKLRLLDVGTQGLDHPTSGWNDRSNYIKYLFYQVGTL